MKLQSFVKKFYATETRTEQILYPQRKKHLFLLQLEMLLSLIGNGNLTRNRLYEQSLQCPKTLTTLIYRRPATFK